MSGLTSDEMNRYQQQIKLNDIGIMGQQQLKHARVLCVGAGGLGSPLLLYLAAAGIGTLGVMDHDIVEISNLQRQLLYDNANIGMKKIHAAKIRLESINPHVKINLYDEKLSVNNAHYLFPQYNVVADCSDNFATRYLVNDVCFQYDIPYVSASVSLFEGYCFTFLGKQGPCYRCLFPTPPKENEFLNCDMGGVLGMVPGLFGILQAAEIIKLLSTLGKTLVGRLLIIDLLKIQFKELTWSKNPDCDLCGNYRMIGQSRKKSILANVIEKPNATMRGHIAMKEYLISPSELKETLKNNENIQLIDVRTIEKHELFNIGGMHIPLAELPNRLNELDSGKLTVTYCTSGGRSMTALQYLLSVGFKSVKSLDGGMTAWQEQQ